MTNCPLEKSLSLFYSPHLFQTLTLCSSHQSGVWWAPRNLCFVEVHGDACSGTRWVYCLLQWRGTHTRRNHEAPWSKDVKKGLGIWVWLGKGLGRVQGSRGLLSSRCSWKGGDSIIGHLRNLICREETKVVMGKEAAATHAAQKEEMFSVLLFIQWLWFSLGLHKIMKGLILTHFVILTEGPCPMPAFCEIPCVSRRRTRWPGLLSSCDPYQTPVPRCQGCILLFQFKCLYSIKSVLELYDIFVMNISGSLLKCCFSH